MKAKVQWKDNLNFEAQFEDGQTMMFGADGKYPSPMQSLLASVGGCSSIDVMMILQKGREDVTDCVCELTTKRAESVPKVFEEINAHFTVTGHNLKESKVKRACELSFTKYCSVSIMLGGRVKITHSYEVNEAE